MLSVIEFRKGNIAMTPMTHMLFTWTGQQLGISNLKKGFFVRMVKPELPITRFSTMGEP